MVPADETAVSPILRIIQTRISMGIVITSRFAN